ncbi:hypothetical protein GCM10029992_48670 [Glycomyces albus]
MRTRHAPAACAALYGLAHLLWGWGGAPDFVRAESFFDQAWVGAIPALAAASGYVGLRHERERRWMRWAALGAAWAGCLGLLAYCLLLWPSLAALLTVVPFGEPVTSTEVGAVGLRSVGTASAIGVAAAVLPEARVLRGVCPDCGGSHAAPDRDDSDRLLGYLGAYFALACCSLRMAPAIGAWIEDGGVGGADGFMVFVVALVAAGTVLPLALAHSWGRIWPRWVFPLAGRRVPGGWSWGPEWWWVQGCPPTSGSGASPPWSSGRPEERRTSWPTSGGAWD